MKYTRNETRGEKKAGKLFQSSTIVAKKIRHARCWKSFSFFLKDVIKKRANNSFIGRMNNGIVYELRSQVLHTCEFFSFFVNLP